MFQAPGARWSLVIGRCHDPRGPGLDAADDEGEIQASEPFDVLAVAATAVRFDDAVVEEFGVDELFQPGDVLDAEGGAVVLLREVAAFFFPFLEADLDVAGRAADLHEPEAGSVPVYVQISVQALVELLESAGTSGVPEEKRLLGLVDDTFPHASWTQFGSRIWSILW